jgi:hypothetical protein
MSLESGRPNVHPKLNLVTGIVDVLGRSHIIPGLGIRVVCLQ